MHYTQVASRNEHVPEIERYIRTIKEWLRAIANSLPFKKYPPRLIAEMVYKVMFWLNSFPHKNGVHMTISPRTLRTLLAILDTDTENTTTIDKLTQETESNYAKEANEDSEENRPAKQAQGENTENNVVEQDMGNEETTQEAVIDHE